MISFHMQYRQIYWRSEHFVRTAVEIIGLSHLFTFLHIQKSPLWITWLMPKVHQKSEWYVWYYWRSPLSCSVTILFTFVVCVWVSYQVSLWRPFLFGSPPKPNRILLSSQVSFSFPRPQHVSDSSLDISAVLPSPSSSDTFPQRFRGVVHSYYV